MSIHDDYEVILEIEDTLSDFDCFSCYINPEKKRPHPDSYGSIFEPSKVSEELLNKFSLEQWKSATFYWQTNQNCYIQWKVAALVIAQKLGFLSELPKLGE